MWLDTDRASAHRALADCYTSLKLSGKVYSLCAVGDAMELTKALDRYEDIDYTFSGSREGKLLRVRLQHISKDFLC